MEDRKRAALIIDDSATARIMLARVLDSLDLLCHQARSGNEALEWLKGPQTVDVIFLDHLMPGLDGFQTLHALKQNPATRRIPVVMFTSQAAPRYQDEARQRGAIGVITKQVDKAALSQLLERAWLAAAASEDQPPPAMRPSTRNVRSQARRSTGAVSRPAASPARKTRVRPRAAAPEVNTGTARATSPSQSDFSATRAASGPEFVPVSRPATQADPVDRSASGTEESHPASEPPLTALPSRELEASTAMPQDFRSQLLGRVNRMRWAMLLVIAALIWSCSQQATLQNTLEQQQAQLDRQQQRLEKLTQRLSQQEDETEMMQIQADKDRKSLTDLISIVEDSPGAP